FVDGIDVDGRLRCDRPMGVDSAVHISSSLPAPAIAAPRGLATDFLQEFCKPSALFLFLRAARALPPLGAGSATAPSAAGNERSDKMRKAIIAVAAAAAIAPGLVVTPPVAHANGECYSGGNQAAASQ